MSHLSTPSQLLHSCSDFRPVLSSSYSLSPRSLSAPSFSPSDPPAITSTWRRGTVHVHLPQCALSAVFVCSWSPGIVYLMWKGVNPDLQFVLEQVAVNCVLINTCNPILYTTTNRRCGRFVWRMATSIKLRKAAPPLSSF